MCLIVTGAAGFIGFHLTKKHLEQGEQVIGIDNLNDYYDVRLKQARLRQLRAYPNFQFYPQDITDLTAINQIFAKHQPTVVVHLAAQPGVRYSLKNPHAYVEANLVGFTNVIEACRHHQIKHLVYASTSSVYGANQSHPYRENDGANHPLTLYAATKKANELIAHSYSHLYRLSTTGLRFFTVYGPWGRPDMAFFSFTRDILLGKPIKIFNHGQLERDFTYIDDIVAAISLAIAKPAQANPDWSALTTEAASSNAPYRIYNIGCGNPIHLMDYIEAIEKATGKTAYKEFLPMQPGDTLITHADTRRFEEDFGYLPRINYQEGIARFVDWYLHFYQ